MGWTIDNDDDDDDDNDSEGAVPKRSSTNTNAYHVIGASRSGFYLSDDTNQPRRRRGVNSSSSSSSSSDTDTEISTSSSSKLIPCTRYGQRVKKPKSKNGHGGHDDGHHVHEGH